MTDKDNIGSGQGIVNQWCEGRGDSNDEVTRSSFQDYRSVRLHQDPAIDRWAILALSLRDKSPGSASHPAADVGKEAQKGRNDTH